MKLLVTILLTICFGSSIINNPAPVNAKLISILVAAFIFVVVYLLADPLISWWNKSNLNKTKFVQYFYYRGTRGLRSLSIIGLIIGGLAFILQNTMPIESFTSTTGYLNGLAIVFFIFSGSVVFFFQEAKIKK